MIGVMSHYPQFYEYELKDAVETQTPEPPTLASLNHIFAPRVNSYAMTKSRLGRTGGVGGPIVFHLKVGETFYGYNSALPIGPDQPQRSGQILGFHPHRDVRGASVSTPAVQDVPGAAAILVMNDAAVKAGGGDGGGGGADGGFSGGGGGGGGGILNPPGLSPRGNGGAGGPPDGADGGDCVDETAGSGGLGTLTGGAAFPDGAGADGEDCAMVGYRLDDPFHGGETFDAPPVYWQNFNAGTCWGGGGGGRGGFNVGNKDGFDGGDAGIDAPIDGGEGGFSLFYAADVTHTPITILGVTTEVRGTIEA